MGEPAGIGGEIALKAWRHRAEGLPVFFASDDPARLTALARQLELDVPVREIEQTEEAAGVFASALPVLPQVVPAPVVYGRADPANARAVIASIERAVSLTLTGEAAAVVTNPIQKRSLYEAGFRHPGHTEFLAELAHLRAAPVMMLATEELRVIPVTAHLPLREAIAALETRTIVHCGRVAAQALMRDFGIAAPRLAIAALNPHAGEGGSLGREEAEILAPAAAALREAGIEVIGPAPADTLFHEAVRAGYDAALCMYHDQALIPLKTIDFDGGVNITLGLPFVRTSPDHGTALDIAGRGAARETSLVAALRLAAELAARRAAAAQQ